MHLIAHVLWHTYMRAYCLHRILKPGKQTAGIDASMIKNNEKFFPRYRHVIKYKVK